MEKSKNQIDSQIKEDLAYAYRIISHLKLDDHTYTHLSARSNDKEFFYVFPFGMLFNEVTPDTLIKASLDGKIIEGSEYQYNQTGYVIHGSIYKERKDINSIFHLHTPEIVAVASIKQGLMPINQWALHFYNRVSYHNYNSLALDSVYGNSLAKDLEDNMVMLMRNHGAVLCGKTIQEAMFYTYHLQQACKSQCMTLSMNSNYVTPDHETCEKSVQELLFFEKNLGYRDWLAWKRLVRLDEKGL